MQPKPKIDEKKLTPEQRDKLEAYQQTQTQLQTLQDIADIAQETLSVLDSQKKDGSRSSEQMGALLVDIRESLAALKDKEAPETPDYAKPVVDAVSKLESKLESAIKAIDVKPNVNIDPPQVNVNPPVVDLKGVEKAVKEIPKAFAQAVKQIDIPRPEKTDFQPLLDAWEGISEQLVSIENATRMKPLPGSMAISNLADIITQTDALTDDELRASAIDVNVTGGNVTLEATDIEIGAVEIKDGASDNRVTVDSSGNLQTEVNAVVPNTGATNLGKAIDNAVGATDTGVALLVRKDTDNSQSSVADGDYDTPSLSSWRELRTRDQRAQDIDNCNATTGWSVLNNDATGLATSTNHVFGTAALTFNKANGSANTAFAIIQKTITAINIQDKFEDGGFVALAIYLPSLTNVIGATIRLGTSASHYNEWEWSADDLSAGRWLALRTPTNQPSTVVGNGWDTSSVTYVAVGVEFNSESNTLSGIIVDNIHFVQGRITDSTIDSTVTTNVTSPNVNLHRVGGTQTDTNAGNASAGTQRVVLATDQPAIDVNASVEAAIYTTRIDEASETVTYIGDATIGSATSGALWRIKKIDTTSGTSITFADGNGNFDGVWDDRASLTYS